LQPYEGVSTRHLAEAGLIVIFADFDYFSIPFLRLNVIITAMPELGSDTTSIFA